MVASLIPTPRCHFLTTSYTPFTSDKVEQVRSEFTRFAPPISVLTKFVCFLVFKGSSCAKNNGTRCDETTTSTKESTGFNFLLE